MFILVRLHAVFFYDHSQYDEFQDNCGYNGAFLFFMRKRLQIKGSHDVCALSGENEQAVVFELV
jgi:hypothetical protein